MNIENISPTLNHSPVREGEEATLDILHRDELPLGGFAGLREHRLVMDPKAWGPGAEAGAWPGIGNLVYLADARFMPHGETMMHEHRGIDVISVVAEGRISHAGSLGQGEELSALAVQVQRSGGEGFAHNEINPDPAWNRMIQIWALPEEPEWSAGYKVYRPEAGEVTRVYGGPMDQSETFGGRTYIDLASVREGETASWDGESLAYLIKGAGTIAGQRVKDGDLVRAHGLRFQALADAELIVTHTVPEAR